MATVTSYPFTITQVNSDQLTSLIQASAIVTALDHIDTTGTSVLVWFKDVLSSADQTTLTALVSSYVYQAPNTQAGPTNADNAPIVELALRRSEPGFSNFTIVSHDFSDRTTWYQKSIQVVGETLTNPSSDGVTFQASTPNWINMNSPKLTYDYNKVLERDGSLSSASMRFAVIQANGMTKVEGTDYTVNYATGTVTFASAPTAPVTATYWHNNFAGCSEFLFVPPVGYEYRIEHVEAQMSKNLTLPSQIILEIWAGAVTSGGAVNVAGYNGFLGAYFDAGYGQSRSYYRSVVDFLNWCTNTTPVIPACGTLTQDVLIMPFLYVVHPVMQANQGTLIRILLDGDTPASAEICTVTLYMEKGPISAA